MYRSADREKLFAGAENGLGIRSPLFAYVRKPETGSFPASVCIFNKILSVEKVEGASQCGVYQAEVMCQVLRFY